MWEVGQKVAIERGGNLQGSSTVSRITKTKVVLRDGSEWRLSGASVGSSRLPSWEAPIRIVPWNSDHEYKVNNYRLKKAIDKSVSKLGTLVATMNNEDLARTSKLLDELLTKASNVGTSDGESSESF